jgi:hypothetical protein
MCAYRLIDYHLSDRDGHNSLVGMGTIGMGTIGKGTSSLVPL